MSEQIYQIRYQEVNPDLAAKLWPFVNAYKDAGPAPTWRELRDEGLEKMDEDSLMDIIIDQYDYEKSARV